MTIGEKEDIQQKKNVFANMKIYAQVTAEETARCKVCFKKFQAEEFFRLCTICKQKVCEDCSASYSTNKEPEVSNMRGKVCVN
jgi:hypothetical protein